MKIKSVQIRNFRALENVSIEFDDVTALIGPNGTGKSTVLRALDWFFNGKPGALNEGDWTHGVDGSQIEVQVTFTQLTDQDRVALGKYAPPSSSTFTAWKVRRSDGSEKLSANTKGFEAFSAIKQASPVAEKKRLYNDLRAAQPGLELVAVKTADDIANAISAWEAAHPDDLVDVDESLETNFFGFNGAGKMSGLFDFVFVPADLRASEESADTKVTILGRILERAIDRTVCDDEIDQIVLDSRRKQQAAYEQAFGAQLSNLSAELSEAVGAYSTGRSVEIAPLDVDLKVPRTAFGVAILDGDTRTAVDRQGHGYQRTLLIAALQILAKYGNAAHNGAICLAIEEPELFQHPIQAQNFAKVLRALGEDAEQRIQVAYATHSPTFVEVGKFHQVRRLTRATAGPAAISVHSATVEDLKSRLTVGMKPMTLDRQFDSMVANQLSNALFADRVLLVEGTTEFSVLSGIADRQSMGVLESKGLVIVPAHGKSNIGYLYLILTSIGIPTYVLFDGDAGFEGRARQRKPSTTAAKIDEERASHIAATAALLKLFSHPVEDFPPLMLTDRFAVLEDNLETILSAEWPDWQKVVDNYEATHGIDPKKHHAAYRAAALEAVGEAPSVLLDVLSKALEVTIR